MFRVRTASLTLFLFACIAFIGFSSPSDAGDRASRSMEKNDQDGDGMISRDEWRKGKRRFNRIDTDGDDYLTIEELRARFGDGDDGPRKKRRERSEESEEKKEFRSSDMYVKGRVMGDYGRSDADGDDLLDRTEWNRRGNFDKMDTDGDGYLSFEEVLAMYYPPSGKGMISYDRPPGEVSEESSPTVAESLIDVSGFDEDFLCAIARSRGCDIDLAINRGFFETGLRPLFPEDADCFAIDDGYAMDYSFKRNRRNYHGGIDIPAPYGVPMLAIADGTVVAVYGGAYSKRGKEVVLRHSPEDTGLPLWIYSQYSHLDELPDFEIGQRIRMGGIIGPTGNSGLGGRGGGQSKKRRPGIHFGMWYSEKPEFADYEDKIVPDDGYWMDALAIYRQTLPVDSESLRGLPDEEKFVSIPVIYPDGATEPEETKLIWPYACTRG